MTEEEKAAQKAKPVATTPIPGTPWQVTAAVGRTRLLLEPPGRLLGSQNEGWCVKSVLLLCCCPQQCQVPLASAAHSVPVLLVLCGVHWLFCHLCLQSWGSLTRTSYPSLCLCHQFCLVWNEILAKKKSCPVPWGTNSCSCWPKQGFWVFFDLAQKLLGCPWDVMRKVTLGVIYVNHLCVFV